MAQQIFKGFKQLSAAAFSAISPEVGVLYFIRTSETKEDGYLYFNGKKYGTAKDADSALKEVLGNLPSGETTFAGWINKEVAALNNEDARLSSAITDEVAARVAAVSALTNDIADEVAAREAAVETLQSAITLESAARTARDEELQKAIADEVSARTTADAELESAINDEVTARTAAVNALNSALADEVTARTAADKALLGDETGTTTDGATIYDVKRFAASINASAHTHDNKAVLDGISAEKVSAWDAAEQNAKSHAESKIAEAVQGLDATASAVSADETILSISEENGIISASKQKIAILHTQVTDWDVELAKKQDNLVFTSTYDPENNKVVTEAEIKLLQGAMHFVGVSETNPAEGATIPSHEGAFKAGDVCLWGVKEFIYDGATWHEIGDEGLYVTKATTIAGVDLQDNISKTELLSALNVADGAQVNKLESVKVNGTPLNIDGNKAVDVTVTSGSTNGTIAVNGADVKVTGFDTAISDLKKAIADAQSAATKYTDDKVAGLDAVVTGESSGTTVVVTEVDGVITKVAVENHISAAKNNAIKMNADGFFAAIYYEDNDPVA